MNELLDLATVKIDLVLKGDFLAKATLNWQNEFEVRFFRITVNKQGGIWIQPPSLKGFGWAVCFAVLDVEEWNRLKRKISDAFFQALESHEGAISPLIENLRSARNSEEIDPDSIPI